MDIERAVVTKILATGNVEKPLSKGVRSEHFADDDCREMYEWIIEHVRNYKVVPSGEAVAIDKPDWQNHPVDDPLDYLLDAFIGVVKRRLAQELVLELAIAADDPERSQTIDLEFLEVSRKLATIVPSTQVSRWKESAEDRIDDYERRKKEGIKTGINFGFPWLDEATGGIQPHEFVTISGFSGLGKSTFGMVVTHNIWAQGKTPLYISLEMEASAIARKIDAMAHGVDYWRMKHLELSDLEVDNWREKAKKIKDSLGEIPIIDNIRGCTPDAVFGETVRHKPDIVIVDYLSLMRSGRPTHRGTSMWQSLTEITQDLKQNARTLGIPIMAMAQTNRSGGKDGAELDNIGYSISVVQDSDIVIGLFADDEMKERRRMQIRLNKNRDGKIGQFEAIWNHENMIFRERDEEDRFGTPGGNPEKEAAAFRRRKAKPRPGR